MKDKNLKGYLQQSLGEEVQPKRLEETIKLCTEIVREQEGLGQNRGQVSFPIFQTYFALKVFQYLVCRQ